jgi:MFS family permease
VALWSLHGIPAALVNNGFFGILGEAVPARERPRLNGIRWGLFGVVAAAVTGVFGYLLDLLPFPLGYQLVFAASGLFGLIGLLYFRKIVLPPQSRGGPAPRRGLAELFWPRGAGREFLEFQVLTAILRVGLHLPIGLFSIWWVNDLQATDTWIGIRSTVANGALVVGYFGWGWISARIGHRWTLGISSGGMALYPALTALGPTVEWKLPAAFFWGVFVAGVDFALVEGLLRASPVERRAEFVAVHHFQANVVAFIAPLVGAWLADRTSIPQVMLVATVFHVFVLAAMAAPRTAPRGGG